MALTAKVREEVLWSGNCAYCGTFPTQVDHVVPVSRGGTDDRANLVPACKFCNMEKLDFTPEEWREWRESEGMGWPPPRVLEGIIREMAGRYGLTTDDLARIGRKILRDALAASEEPCP